MLNVIWLVLVIGAIIIGMINGTISAVVASITTSAGQAVTVVIGLIGMMTLWLGIMRIAEDAGLIKLMSRIISPIMRVLFPQIPVDHPAMGAMSLNIAANVLGVGNAATPFGLRAMEELAKLNTHPGIASNAMCMFLAINTSSVQIIPATTIAILAANGSTAATSIVFPILIATTCSTLAGILAAKTFARLPLFKIRDGSTYDSTALR
jgi:spore maturation protein A